MIGTDLQGSVSPHQEADCASLFVFQQLDITGSSLLPLWWVVLRGKTVQFSPPEGKTNIQCRKYTTLPDLTKWVRTKKSRVYHNNLHFKEFLLVLFQCFHILLRKGHDGLKVGIMIRFFGIFCSSFMVFLVLEGNAMNVLHWIKKNSIYDSHSEYVTAIGSVWFFTRSLEQNDLWQSTDGPACMLQWRGLRAHWLSIAFVWELAEPLVNHYCWAQHLWFNLALHFLALMLKAHCNCNTCGSYNKRKKRKRTDEVR